MEENGLLDSYLRHLRLPTFLKNYRQFSTDAAGKNLDHTRYLLDLTRGEYLQKRKSIIFVGNPGLGKTHLATGIALAACRQKRKVRFWTTASLAGGLLQAQDAHRLHRFIGQALKMDLVVLDELGFIPFSANGAQVLFTFCSELYERLSFILTTNLKFADWVQVFGDERLTEALLDRLTHHAHIIELVGESFRFRP